MEIYSFTYCKKCKTRLDARLYIEKDTLYQEIDVDCECVKAAKQLRGADSEGKPCKKHGIPDCIPCDMAGE